MVPVNNKKAFVFTIIVITIILLFMSSYGVYSIVKSRDSVNKRIETLNSYVDSTEKDLPRAVYISTFRIVFLLEQKIIDRSEYITNFDSAFKEAFYNGTFNGVVEPIMYGATLPGIIQSANSKASKINGNVNFIAYNLTVYQEDPWNVMVNLTGNLVLRDNGGLASWNKTESFVAKVPIENFEDPIYFISTSGLVTNKIRRSPYSNFVSGSDVTNLTLNIENSYYINSSTAPSFLDRFEGDLGASNPNGIESLVYLPKLSAQSIIIEDKSCVDYIYFSSNDPLSKGVKHVSWPWFRLDYNHFSIYGAEEA
jgi:hypothetical protein